MCGWIILNTIHGPTNVQTGTRSEPTFEYRTTGTINAIIDGTPISPNSKQGNSLVVYNCGKQRKRIKW